MNTFTRASLTVWICLGATSIFIETAIATDNIKVEGTKDFTWTSDGKSSTTDGAPLILQVNKGDTIQINIPDLVDILHGFITIDKKGNESPAETKDFVLTCGENQQSKPNAVLREISCEIPERCICKDDLSSLFSSVMFWRTLRGRP